MLPGKSCRDMGHHIDRIGRHHQNSIRGILQNARHNFMKYSGVPSEQLAAGGLSTVRGYLEREVLGDDGVIGTIELRSPVLASALTERLFTREKSASGDFEKLQFVLFTDGAYLSQKETLPGDEDTETLLSVGAGLRLALGENFQSRFDWGFPLEETVESDSSGRGHVSVQFLF